MKNDGGSGCAFARMYEKKIRYFIMSTDPNIPIEETAKAKEYLEGKKADYQNKIANKEEYWQLKAQKLQLEANSRYNSSKSITDPIPLGQPILVGHHSERRHRRDIQRSHDDMRKSVEAQNKADYYASKTVSTAIASDDPEAIQKLKDKLEQLQNNQEYMKLVNKLWRKAGKPHPEFLTKSAIAKHRSLTGSGFEQSDRRFPQPTVCCQILS